MIPLCVTCVFVLTPRTRCIRRYNDGCNTCSVSNGVLGGCTDMACFMQGTPFCALYTDGRACTMQGGASTPTCTQGSAVGAGAALGAHCSTSHTRGNPNGVPCAAGLNCQITPTGVRPPMDVGNSGVCTDPSAPIAVDPMPYPGAPPQRPYEPPMVRPGGGGGMIEPPQLLHPTDPMPTVSEFCAASAMSRCRMMCSPPTCAAGQCAMRVGTCCDFTCQASDDAATIGSTGNTGAATGACTAATSGRPMPGAFVPQCDEQGDYMPVQCHGSVGSCWCSDAQGTEIPGTRINSRGGQVLDIATCAAASHPDIMIPPVDPGFGMPTTTGQQGARCAAGFCENANDCPQCATGLTCAVQPMQACAGTCYGTCSKSGH